MYTLVVNLPFQIVFELRNFNVFQSKRQVFLLIKFYCGKVENSIYITKILILQVQYDYKCSKWYKNWPQLCLMYY